MDQHSDMDVNIPYDCILVQTDIAFNLALEVLADLQRNGQLQLRTSQTVTIDNIESNDSRDDLCFTFGGAHAASYKKKTTVFCKDGIKCSTVVYVAISKCEPLLSYVRKSLIPSKQK